MNVLNRIAYVVTLAWAIVMGGLVPGFVLGLAYGRTAGILIALVGGAIGFFVHRFAWAD